MDAHVDAASAQIPAMTSRRVQDELCMPAIVRARGQASQMTIVLLDFSERSAVSYGLHTLTVGEQAGSILSTPFVSTTQAWMLKTEESNFRVHVMSWPTSEV